MSTGQADPMAASARAERLSLHSWALYDLAKSPFKDVVIVFVLSAYFVNSVAESPEVGTTLLGWATGAGALAAALLAPLLGAVADRSGRRKPWLAGLTLFCAAVVAGMWCVTPSPASVALALALGISAGIAYDMINVFYSSLLPSVAPPHRIGRWSGIAEATGAAGSMVCLGLTATLLVGLSADHVPPFGLDREASEHIRAVGPTVALWFLIFSLPMFLFTRDEGRAAPERERNPIATVRALSESLRTWPGKRTLYWYLLARMLYIDGMAAISTFTAPYAIAVAGMEEAEVMLFGAVAIPVFGVGAAAGGVLADKIGPKHTVAAGLAGLIAALVGLLFAACAATFWSVGLAAAFALGPVAAADRALMARLAPPEHRIKAFGLHALSGKITVWAVPPAIGTLTLLADDLRVGYALIAPLLVGGLLVLIVRVAELAVPSVRPSGVRSPGPRGSRG